MGFRILKAGVFDTVQDLGRHGFRRLGINPGGAMDRTAARLLNLLLGNSEDAPVIEMHFPSPELEFISSEVIAVGGADFAPLTGDGPLGLWTAARVAKGSVLRFAKRRFGSRSYLAVKGGLSADDWLGSASTNLFSRSGGFGGRRLVAGDVIESAATTKEDPSGSDLRLRGTALGLAIRPAYSETPLLRIIEGPEYQLLTGLSTRDLQNGEFIVAQDSDRMGYRLEGPRLHLLERYEMLSTAVDFGTLQLLPSGQLVLLMADHQTTGGYPRIGSVAGVDLSVAAQAGPGTALRFRIVTVGEAEELERDLERDLRFLRMGLRFRGI